MPNSFRAPAQHGETLLLPTGSLIDLIRSNEAALNASPSLAAIRAEARHEVLALATRWTTELVGPVEPPRDSGIWIIGGHQPELFHSGVWIKNAVVSELASELGGVGLNLVVDNDLCAKSSVSVPLSPDSQRLATLEWDQPRPHSPWEERPAPDEKLFASFGERCRQHLKPWGIDPLAASQDWAGIPERGIVDRLVRLRGMFERDCGVRNLELKVSDLADTRCFRRFLLRTLNQADLLRETYNTALTDYRTLHRIRSRSHPVPALDSTELGIEVPFWVWRAGETRRSRLFVRSISPGIIVLHDGQQQFARLSTSSEYVALDQLAELRQQGWKIRPRALTLTLFCRTYLGSAFVHGIGGAKYDEMTDVLIERWLGLSPPSLIVATSTLRLFESFAPPRVESLIAQDQRELRRIHWNPEAITASAHSTPSAQDLITRKQELLDGSMSSSERHVQIQQINASLRSGLAEYEQRIRSDLQSKLTSQPYQVALRGREYSANLFPASAIRELFQRIQQEVLTQK